MEERFACITFDEWLLVRRVRISTVLHVNHADPPKSDANRIFLITASLINGDMIRKPC